MDLEQEFFKVYEIEPQFKKGEYYITSLLRFAEVQAQEDIPWNLPPEKLWELEDVICCFELDIQPGPMDEKVYRYKHGVNSGRLCINRKDALLDFLIQNVRFYKTRVQLLFPEHKRRFEPLQTNVTWTTLDSI